MAKEYMNYIGGKWIKSGTGRTYENYNPANGEVLGIFPRSDSKDVKKAVDAAEKAFKTWRLLPAPRRAEILFKAGELLIERKEEYAREMTQEMGKVLTETRGDVQEAIDLTYYAAGEGRRLLGETTPSELDTLMEDNAGIGGRECSHLQAGEIHTQICAEHG
jgi:acyl-CoA reductase-like NAD-dependent aldehyde dehydrogenase